MPTTLKNKAIILLHIVVKQGIILSYIIYNFNTYLKAPKSPLFNFKKPYSKKCYLLKQGF